MARSCIRQRTDVSSPRSELDLRTQFCAASHTDAILATGGRIEIPLVRQVVEVQLEGSLMAEDLRRVTTRSGEQGNRRDLPLVLRIDESFSDIRRTHCQR